MSETKSVGKLYRENLVDLLKSGVEDNDNVFVLSYSKVDAAQIGNLRKSLRKAGASVYVPKNSLARLALKEAKQEELAQNIEGQTAFIWSNSDSVEVSKILVGFSKDIETVALKGGLLGEKALQEADIKRLSDLPPKDVLRAQLLAIIQAPITQLMGAMNAKSRELLSILKQYSEKKGGS